MKIRLLVFAWTLLFCFQMSSQPAWAQKKKAASNNTAAKALPPLERVEPAFWWTGMKSPKLQLLVHGNGIAASEVKITYPGVQLAKVNKVENPNYLFLDLVIDATAKAGKFPITFDSKGKKLTYTYELQQKSTATNRIQGVNASDFIYLIMPDRFANGDPKNDVVNGMNETTLKRDSMYYRHGGDLQGVLDHLDYLKDLGVTTIWLNPALENDQPRTSYHGYAFTDHYKIDPRLGTNELYQTLVAKCHEKGLKVIMDLVHNHVGSEHWFVKDLPSKDWLHQWPQYTNTTYKDATLMDPYASERDKKLMSDGWFDKHMPDLNQSNPFVANYLNQNYLWWIEYAGLDGFRLDTYAYNDLAYMAEWGKLMASEYPKLGIFAETWVHSVVNQSYFTQNNHLKPGYNSNLPGVTDFQLHFALDDALNEEFGWTSGVNKLYMVLSNDFVYEDPTRNVTFVDNHDISRFYSVVGEDFNKFKSGLAFVLTTRGIPSLYYGTEILMKNLANPDGKVREDFPGGWPGDKKNKFTKEGRTEQENEAFEFVRTLANWRKQHPVLQTGKLMQYVPEQGVYVYFRYNDNETVMIVMNTSKKEVSVATERFSERTKGFTGIRDILTGKAETNFQTIKAPAQTTLVLELTK